MAAINYTATLNEIEGWTIIHLPKAESQKLPSRGLAMAKGRVGGVAMRIVIEPDGKGSHWFMLPDTVAESLAVKAGDTLEVQLDSAEDWDEPEVPTDMKAALEAAPAAHEAWADITSLARWDWVRWIRATKVARTREKRINTAIDMLSSGKRRPCCFDRSQCTVPDVSRSGVLLTALD
jgi:hypothetical protein